MCVKWYFKILSIIFFLGHTMSEEKKNHDDIEEERKKLNELGVSNTWNILSDLTKKKKEQK